MKYFVIFIVLLTFFSCSSDETSGSNINGAIKDYDPNSLVKQVYLYDLGPQSFIPVDTAMVQENGKFIFDVSSFKEGIYTIGLAPNNAITVYIDSLNKSQELTINELKRWTKSYAIEGSYVSNEIASFTTEVNNMITKGGDYNRRISALSFNDTLQQRQIREEFQQESEAFMKKRNAYIEKNMKSPALIAVLDQIDPLQEMDLLKDVVINGLGVSMPNSNYFINTKNYLTQLEAEIAQKEKLKNFLKPGTMAPDLNFPGVDGKNVALSSLRGKVVLLDFWASWCRPCRAENPNVVRLYNKYKNQGFEIYSFSLDQNKDKWLNAIKQDGLIWNAHASDLKGWQTAAIPIYGFNSIPFTILIDREGKVIAKKLRGQALENKLAEIF